MEKQLQKTIEAASQIEEIISKKIPTAPKERTFWTTAVGIEEAVEMIRSNFEEAEKEICIILHINCCIPLSSGQKRFPLFEFICGLEFKSQDLILEP